MILRYPDGVLRVGRGDGLLLPVTDLLLREEGGVRLLDRAIEVAHHPCRFDVRQDLRLPHQEVLPGELLGDGVAERCEGRGGSECTRGRADGAATRVLHLGLLPFRHLYVK